ncbi:PGF-CTERM-anchored ABC transporter substrate-binding protein [Halapricum salinum]|uniref:ABC transporter substrate-binding protein n=1 Tax=Halapricum salinum TaxID=1457250 RepID=A0A4D6HG47_9EURY|nr:PGF-CTERM-anchored ABC transporter substrate-binding protein [Halapricum salinum]QCC52515.1 ABC transporter substrate-binding protein [Halapricum salinum]
MRRAGLTVVVLVVVLSSGGVVAGVHPTDASSTGKIAVQTQQTADCSYPVEVTDATGETVTIDERPERIVAIAPSAAQTAWAVGAQDRVVGMPVGYTTAYLNGTENKTNVLNSELQPVTETVVDLEPDIVLAGNVNFNDSIQSLRDADLTVVKFDSASSLADVIAKTRLTGQLVGNCEQAAQTNAEMNETIEQVRAEASGGDDPSVYYAMGGGYTAGPDTFVGDVVETAGGENIATAADIRTYGEINLEVVAAENPDWIVTTSPSRVRWGEVLNSTTAVQEDQIVTLNGNYMSQPGPRITRPLQRLSAVFNPDNSSEATATPETPTNPNDTEETTDSSDTGSGFGPGFGVVGALLALAMAGLASRQR